MKKYTYLLYYSKAGIPKGQWDNVPLAAQSVEKPTDAHTEGEIKVSLRQLADVSLLQRLAESYMKNNVFHVRQSLWSHTFAEGKLRSFALRNVRSAEREIPLSAFFFGKIWG